MAVRTVYAPRLCERRVTAPSLVRRTRQGGWARENMHTLQVEELRQFGLLLQLETPDLFRYISGQEPCPTEHDTAMMKRIQEYVLAREAESKKK